MDDGSLVPVAHRLAFSDPGTLVNELTLRGPTFLASNPTVADTYIDVAKIDDSAEALAFLRTSNREI